MKAKPVRVHVPVIGDGIVELKGTKRAVDHLLALIMAGKQAREDYLDEAIEETLNRVPTKH